MSQRVGFSGSGASDYQEWRSDRTILRHAMLDGATLLRV
jgi:hypothetical protein